MSERWRGNDLRLRSASASHQPVWRPSGGGGVQSWKADFFQFEVCAGLKLEALAGGGSHKSNVGVQRSAGLQAAGSSVTCGHYCFLVSSSCPLFLFCGHISANAGQPPRRGRQFIAEFSTLLKGTSAGLKVFWHFLYYWNTFHVLASSSFAGSDGSSAGGASAVVHA